MSAQVSLTRSSECHDDTSFSSRAEESTDKNQVRQCPYLDTINRHVLDFDFEKVRCYPEPGEQIGVDRLSHSFFSAV